MTAPVEEEEATTPHDPQCEAAILGALLRGERTPVVDARRALPPDWCFEPKHQRIWDAVTKQDDDGYGTDLYALTQAGLKPDDLTYALTLVHEAPPVSMLPYYLKQAAKTARLRAADEATMRMQRAIRRADIDTLDQAAAAARDALDELDTQGANQDEWAALDLTTALEGGNDVPAPNVLERVDGQCLLYPGRTHSVAGEPGHGKSWLVIIGAAQCLIGGRNVIYIDYEDSAAGITSRLVKLGVPADVIKQRFFYHRPNRQFDSPAKALLRAEFEEAAPALVVIDGVTEAMMEEGLDGQGDPNEKAAAFYKKLPRYLVRLVGEHEDGPAVVMVDHVAKDKDNRGRWMIGGQHKMSGLSGAAYSFEQVTPFDRGAEGKALVRISKDRENQVGPAGKVIAELVLDERAEGELKWELRVPEEMPEGEDGQPRPTILMEQISRHLAAHAGATKTQVCEAVGGNKQLKLRAIDCLVAEGYVSEVKRGRMSVLTNLGRYVKEWDRGGQ